MKKKICLLFIIMIFGTTVFARGDLLDVFEEYASFEDSICKTGSVICETEKNKEVTGKFIIECDESYEIEIIKNPDKGNVEIIREKNEFIYTPDRGITGGDSFSYRINTPTVNSNISRCSITVTEAKKEKNRETTDFYYADMTARSGEYAAVKLVELGVIKGERVGGEYYFYPDSAVTKNQAISYINSAVGLDSEHSDEKAFDIFSDCRELPYQIKKNAYLAYSSGIIDAQEDREEKYLYPYENITRAEFFVMLDRAVGGKTHSETQLLYPDRSLIPDKAEICIKNLVAYDIIDNSEKINLRPDDLISREEACEALYRMIKYREDSTVKTLSQRIKEEFYGTIIS